MHKIFCKKFYRTGLKQNFFSNLRVILIPSCFQLPRARSLHKFRVMVRRPATLPLRQRRTGVQLLHPRGLLHCLFKLRCSVGRRSGGPHIHRHRVLLRVQALATGPEERHCVRNRTHFFRI